LVHIIYFSIFSARTSEPCPLRFTEKSLSLWSEERDIKTTYKNIFEVLKKQKDFTAVKQATDIFWILKYSKQISMLTR